MSPDAINLMMQNA